MMSAATVRPAPRPLLLRLDPRAVTRGLNARLRNLDRRAVARGLVAGAVWGVLFAAGLILLEAQRCGAVCLDAAAFTALLSTAIGVLAIGPVAALGRPAS